MKEEHLHPYLQLRAHFLDVKRVWKQAIQRRSLMNHRDSYLEQYYSQVSLVLDYYVKDSVFLIKNIDGFQNGDMETKENALFDLLENFSFTSPSRSHLPPSENEKLLIELSKLTLDRLYRLSRRYLGLENESYEEEDFLLHREDLLASWLLGFFEHTSSYLKSVNSQMQIEEGRLEVERMLQSMEHLLPQLSALVGRDVERNQRNEEVIRDYFESYAFCLRLEERLDWEFLAGVNRRLRLTLQKATHEFNRVLVSRELRQLSLVSGELLAKIPQHYCRLPQSNIERRCYQKMVNGLFVVNQRIVNQELSELSGGLNV